MTSTVKFHYYAICNDLEGKKGVVMCQVWQNCPTSNINRCKKNFDQKLSQMPSAQLREKPQK